MTTTATTTRPVAVYTDVVDTDPEPGIALLERSGIDVRVLNTADPVAIAQHAGDADALLIGYSPVQAGLLNQLPQLQVIATQSVGVDMIDMPACRQRGIAVCQVPGAATEEVAMHAVAMTLAMVRGLPMLDRQVRVGVWDGTSERLHRPSRLTVGVLGLGRIGRAYAQYMQPIAGRVVGYDPVAAARAAAPAGVDQLDLDDVLRASDVVSLHLPLTEDSSRLLSRDKLALLPDGAFVVNVARGQLIDAEALLELVDTGRLGGAALDVLPVEPPPAGDRLINHPRVLTTPHAAYLSASSAADYVVGQAQNVIDFFAGKPANVVG